MSGPIPGPAPRRRLVHMAAQIRDDGAVSALCYSEPKRIPYTATWTNRPEAVTCQKCKRLLVDEAARRAGLR